MAPDDCEPRTLLYYSTIVYIKLFVNKIVFSYEFKCPENYSNFDTIWQFMDKLSSCLEEQTLINYRPVSPSLIVIPTSSFIRVYITITSYFELKKEKRFKNVYRKFSVSSLRLLNAVLQESLHCGAAVIILTALFWMVTILTKFVFEQLPHGQFRKRG